MKPKWTKRFSPPRESNSRNGGQEGERPGWQHLSIALLILISSILLGVVLFLVGFFVRQHNTSSQAFSTASSQASPVGTITITKDPGLSGTNPAPNGTQNPPSASMQFAPAQAFQFEVADAGQNVGLQSAIALDSTGNPWVAYFDDDQDRVKLAVLSARKWQYQDLSANFGCKAFPSLKIDPSNKPNLSCGSLNPGDVIFAHLQPDQKWQVSVVAKNVVSAGTALVLDRKNRPHLIYIDQGRNKVFYAVEGPKGWIVNEVGDAAGEKTAAGMQAALGVDAQNQPHVLYSNDQKGLIYASLKDGKWTQATVEAGAQVGLFPSLAISPDGRISASYYDKPAQALKFARFDGKSWTVAVIEKGGVGEFSSLAIDSHGLAHISYYDGTNRYLKYASEDEQAHWSTIVVDGSFGVGRFSSLALDAHDHAFISYYSDTDRQLFLSQQVDAAQAKPPVLNVLHRSGQTFLTWPERTEMSGEGYKIYRSSQPFRPDFPSGWNFLGEVGKNSGVFYANRYTGSNIDIWHARYADRLVVESGAQPLPAGVGLFVWTLSAEDFGGKTSGPGYYTVTVTPSGGPEMLLAASSQAVEESVADPEPVEITNLPGSNAGTTGHVYIQYMDFRDWNPTFHAPNPTNNYYGMDPRDPSIPRAVAYAYDYTVFEPTPALCGGKIPDVLPVYVNLHGWRGNRYTTNNINSSPMCAYGIYPIDETETWYFGFAKYHDFRKGGDIQAMEGTQPEVIENYTEQRVLRMVYDLLRHPPRKDAPRADEQRVYVFGHSMGGSGALALAQRYPNVFAAAYSSAPMTDYATAGVTNLNWADNVAIKWGSQELNLPVLNKAPAGWAQDLQQYNGKRVWDWQNYQNTRLEDMAPLGLDMGVPDDTILWKTQGEPFFQAIDSARQAWSGSATDGVHAWGNFHSLPVSMKTVNYPFWNLTVVKNESVPGLSRLSSNPAFPPIQGSRYYQTIQWSSSWNPWDGAPIDVPEKWQISLCGVAPDKTDCGSGQEQVVDVTPRRLQQFKVIPGAQYDWENVDIASGEVIARGTLAPDKEGFLLVEKFQVNPSGNRLVIQKQKANQADSPSAQ